MLIASFIKKDTNFGLFVLKYKEQTNELTAILQKRKEKSEIEN